MWAHSSQTSCGGWKGKWNGGVEKKRSRRGRRRWVWLERGLGKREMHCLVDIPWAFLTLNLASCIR